MRLSQSADTDNFGDRSAPVHSTEKLSPQLLSIWAKSQSQQAWLPLVQHALDSLAAGERLFDDWLSPQVKNRWAEEGLDLTHMRIITLFLCASHDLGKAAPAFVAQHSTLAERAVAAGLICRPMAELKDDRRALPHSLVSQYALRQWLTGHGVSRDRALALSSVVGAHHGRPMSRSQLLEPKRRPHGAGDEAWSAVRVEMLNWLAELSGFASVLPHLPHIALPILVELAGFVIVADWLASNTQLFPLRPTSADGTPDPSMGRRAQHGWDEIGMPPPWEPPASSLAPEDFYRERFGWPRTARPRSVQRAALEIARRTDVGMMFIETTPGDGKTEAALAAAEIIGAARGSQGLLIALPTQATTNAMFMRVADWVELQPARPPEIGAWALTLAHGKARLNKSYARMMDDFAEFERSQPRTTDSSDIDEGEQHHGSDEPCSNAVVHQWFLGAKRRLLSNFAVVTIDQLLMAALQRKHLMLAHVALSGKVVIIDEAHASDEFMNTYLDSALSWLGAYGTPVIVLSATLTAQRRKAMMRAYAPRRIDEIEALRIDEDAYPLITTVPRLGGEITAVQVSGHHITRDVNWSWHPTELKSLVETVRDLTSAGGCALVVRNTVADAQATASELADAGLPVTLAHAGFLSCDRVLIDAELQTLFGRDGEHRPEQHVVVATQVVEQSLDVDFDVLLTDLAPMDLLLQRMGRMHRHSRPRPAHLSVATTYILADRDDDGVPVPTGGSSAVYGPHLLLRTAATLIDHATSINLPDDISPLVQRALGDSTIGPENWQPRLQAAAADRQALLKKQREKASIWRLGPWDPREADERSELGVWLDLANDPSEQEMQATVRDTDPSLEVIVVPLTHDGAAAIRPPWLAADEDGIETLDTSTLPSDDLAREIAGWSVRLPARVTRFRLGELIEAIDQLPETRRWLWRRHALLKGELLLPMRQDQEGGSTLITEVRLGASSTGLRYSPDRGLEVVDS